MDISPSVDLVMQLACREAVASEHARIEPEHVLEGVLKLSEMEVDPAETGSEAGVFGDILAEMLFVREELCRRSLDGTQARRRLRAELGSGGSPYEGGTLHRTQASRDAFECAAGIARRRGSATLGARDLLDALLASPTPIMANVLGAAAGPAPTLRTPAPAVLDAVGGQGRDMTRMAAEGELPDAPERLAECRAVLRALASWDRAGGSPRDGTSLRNGRPTSPCVMLVSGEDGAARSTMAAAAHALAREEAPLGLLGWPIVDVSGIDPNADDASGGLALLRKVLVEAVGGRAFGTGPVGRGTVGAEGVILFLPAVEASPRSHEARGGGNLESWVEALKDALVADHAACVLRVAPGAYRRWIEKDRTWERLAQAMWIREEVGGALPSEL